MGQTEVSAVLSDKAYKNAAQCEIGHWGMLNKLGKGYFFYWPSFLVYPLEKIRSQGRKWGPNPHFYQEYLYVCGRRMGNSLLLSVTDLEWKKAISVNIFSQNKSEERTGAIMQIGFYVAFPPTCFSHPFSQGIHGRLST